MVDLIYILASNTEISLITKDDSGLRRTNVERLKKMLRLPNYLVPLRKDDTDNQYELTCKTLSNKYTTAVAQNSEFVANNLGRGNSTLPDILTNHPLLVLLGFAPATSSIGCRYLQREEAELNNQPCGNIFTTTAGKKDDRDKFMWTLSWAVHIE